MYTKPEKDLLWADLPRVFEGWTLRSIWPEEAAADLNTDLAPDDAAVAQEAEGSHIQLQEQCMGEGPAMARSGVLVPGEAAVAHEAGHDHIQFRHPGMQDVP